MSNDSIVETPVRSESIIFHELIQMERRRAKAKAQYSMIACKMDTDHSLLDRLEKDIHDYENEIMSIEDELVEVYYLKQNEKR